MAGFELTLYGRIWVTPEDQARHEYPHKHSTKCLYFNRHVC
jgi:hypothetical protein